MGARAWEVKGIVTLAVVSEFPFCPPNARNFAWQNVCALTAVRTMLVGSDHLLLDPIPHKSTVLLVTECWFSKQHDAMCYQEAAKFM